MTAVPVTRGHGVQITCDDCGETAVAAGGGMSDTALVYVAVADIGWSGSAFARGPHHCPACVAPTRRVLPRQRPA